MARITHQYLEYAVCTVYMKKRPRNCCRIELTSVLFMFEDRGFESGLELIDLFSRVYDWNIGALFDTATFRMKIRPSSRGQTAVFPRCLNDAMSELLFMSEVVKALG